MGGREFLPLCRPRFQTNPSVRECPTLFIPTHAQLIQICALHHISSCDRRGPPLRLLSFSRIDKLALAIHNCHLRGKSLPTRLCATLKLIIINYQLAAHRHRCCPFAGVSARLAFYHLECRLQCQSLVQREKKIAPLLTC